MEESRKKNIKKQGKKIFCFNCKKEGHYKRNCPEIKCFFCKENHLKMHCIKYYLHLKYKAWKMKKENLNSNQAQRKNTKEDIKEDIHSNKESTKRNEDTKSQADDIKRTYATEPNKIIIKLNKAEGKNENELSKVNQKDKENSSLKESQNMPKQESNLIPNEIQNTLQANKVKPTNKDKKGKPKKKDPMTKRMKWIQRQNLIKEKGLPFLKQTIKLEMQRIQQQNELKKLENKKQIEEQELKIQQTITAISNTQKKKQELIKAIKEKTILEKKENLQILLELEKDYELRSLVTIINNINIDIYNANDRLNSRKKCDKEIRFIKAALTEDHDKLKQLVPEIYQELKEKLKDIKARNDQLIW